MNIPWNVISVALSILTLVGLIISVAATWTKFSIMAEQNQKVLAGYTNPDGSPIFRTKEDCDMKHQSSSELMAKRMDALKRAVLDIAEEGQKGRKHLSDGIKYNRETSATKYYQLKDFMAAALTSLKNLEKGIERRQA